MSYIGTQVNDVVKNTGLYTPSEILQLEKDGHWGGSLELIEEQNVSGVTTLNFTNIKENIYDVHFLHLINYESNTITNRFTHMRLSNDSGSSYETSNYQYAQQYGGTNGAFGELKSTSATSWEKVLGNIANTGNANGYCYLYNLGNSSKYSFMTNHQMGKESTAGTGYFHFGGFAYTVAETINAIQLFIPADEFSSLTAKLYGVKQ
jgi:hypothetical protein